MTTKTGTATTAELQGINQYGWRAGFGNLFKKELVDWWGTRSGWLQILLWVAIINGGVAGTIVALRAQNMPAADVSQAAVQILNMLAGFFGAIGGVIRVQDAVAGERQAGTAAWILSKPVSRSAFILSKVIANALGVLATILLVPAIIGYFELRLFAGYPVPIDSYVAAMGVQALHLLFYVTLTIMLGAVFSTRGWIIGVPLALILGYQAFLAIVPQLYRVMPWGLPDAAVSLMTGNPPVAPTAIAAVPIWMVLFAWFAIYRFSREEL